MSSSSTHTLPGQEVEADRYLVCLVAGAIAGEANYVEIDSSSSASEARFDGRFYTKEDFQSLLELEAEGADQSLYHLAVALSCALRKEPPKVTIESWDGDQGARLRFSDGSCKVEQLSKSPWKGGDPGNLFRVDFKSVWARDVFRRGKEELTPEAELVASLCRFAASRIEVNGQAVGKAIDLGTCFLWASVSPDESHRALRLNPVSPKATMEHRAKTQGNYAAVLAIGGEQEPESRLTVNGVSFECEFPVLEELQFRGVITCSDLTLSEDHTEVEEDDKFEAFLADLESDVLSWSGLLLENVEKMGEDGLTILEGLDYLVELHRSSGEMEEAERLLTDLAKARHEAYGEGDPSVAETVTTLAQVQEAMGKWEECYQTYQEGLAQWDACEEVDERSLAICLNGIAQICYTAEEYEQAEELASRALEIRKETHEAEELELGISYELLARIYATRYSYPHRKFLDIEELYQSALAILEKNYGSHHADVAVILHDLGEYYRGQRKYEQAESVYLRSLAVREKLLGGSDPVVGETLDTLGSLYEDQGQSTKAGRYYLKALEIWEKTLGPEHPEVAQRLNNLVVLYRIYGQYAEAEPFYERILTIREQAVGQDHPDLVPDLCSLALLYQVQGKLAKARKAFERALEILEKAESDEGDLQLAWVHNLLGAVSDEDYDFKKAEVHLNKALELWKAALGPNHPDVAVVLEFLVRHFRTQQRYDEAVPFARGAVAVNEAFYGRKHPLLATSLNTLGDLLRSAGKPQDAKPILHAAWEIRRQAEAPDADFHWAPQVEDLQPGKFTAALISADELHREAEVPAKEFSRYMEAEHLYLRALFAREEVFGPGHPNNARTLEELAELYRTHHKFEGAESLYQRSLELRSKSLGREHPDILISFRNLVKTYLMQRKFDEAEEQAQKWLELAETVLGPEHLEAANAVFALAPVYENREEMDKVEECYRRAMEIRQRVLGVENPEFATSLAELLRVRGDYERSAELYSFVVTAMEEALGGDSVELIPVLENYAFVLKKLGREDEAVPYETQAMVMRVQHGLDFH